MVVDLIEVKVSQDLFSDDSCVTVSFMVLCGQGVHVVVVVVSVVVVGISLILVVVYVGRTVLVVMQEL